MQSGLDRVCLTAAPTRPRHLKRQLRRRSNFKKNERLNFPGSNEKLMEQCFAKFVKWKAKIFLLLVVRQTSKDRHFCGTKNLRIIMWQPMLHTHNGPFRTLSLQLLPKMLRSVFKASQEFENAKKRVHLRKWFFSPKFIFLPNFWLQNSQQPIHTLLACFLEVELC